jgi:hypothetical protein
MHAPLSRLVAALAGRTFYVPDTINLRDHAFTIGELSEPRSVTASTRERGRQAIRTTVEDIAGFYRFHAER